MLAASNTRLAALASLMLMAFAFTANAQYKTKVVLNPDVIEGVFQGETAPLRDFRPHPKAVYERVKAEKLGYHKKGDWILNETVNPNALPQGADPRWQQDYPPMRTNQQPLDQNFDGMGYTGVNPADPSLDVGPNHVIQMINGSSGAYIQIYDKAGAVLVSQFYMDSFFGGYSGLGDPIVVYDEAADRWMITEFTSGNNDMQVAISTTPDPTGTWFKYSYTAPSFPDYPKFAVWDNAYIITSNESGDSPVYALDRTAMLAGSAGTAQRFTVPDFGTIAFQAATPVSWSGTAAPASGTPPMIMRIRDDAWTGATNDALEIWEFDVDFASPGSTSLTLTDELAVSSFDSELCGYTAFACIPQPGTGTQLDPLREVLMNRIFYRNFGTHESIVCTHVTDVDGTDRAGVRWYELRRTGGTAGTWGIYQEGTYSPDADGRFMSSIAIDAFGSIAIAYNVSSSSTFPSLRYTGRKASDPLGVMTEPETTIIAGSASNGSNRYGDYNQMGLDPSDGQTFWFTGKYNASSQWSTRIASFSIAAPGVGCTNGGACNFDPDAITDSGFCTFPGDACSDGDPTTVNDVLQNDCSCAGVTIPGCTDPFADNYDPTATVDDGSCIFTCQPVTFTLNTDCWGAETTWQLVDDDSGTTLASGGPFGNLITVTEDLCLSEGCYTFTIFDSFGDGMDGPSNGFACSTVGSYDWQDGDGNVLISIITANFGTSETQTFCITSDSGCTDQSACNYDPDAATDDGSCEFTSCAGCTDAAACNYDPTATIDNGSCELPDGCTDNTACNYDASATCDDGSCEFMSCAGCTDPAACNYDPTATIENGSCQLPDGCTDPNACNYSASALCDDGSCEYASCDPACLFDLNDDGAVNVGDLLILLGDYGCSGVCVGDLNGDGSVGSADILEMLGVFGVSCAGE